VEYSSLLPPVGVWAVSQSQCGWPSSQTSYGSSPWWAVTPSLRRAYQLANPPQTPPPAPSPSRQRGFFSVLTTENLCGISSSFEELFPTKGQVVYVLLTRPPLAFRKMPVRLACVKHAASVCPEPGSNSPNIDCVTRKGYIKLYFEGTDFCFLLSVSPLFSC
jgi:hypothetical protein